MNDLPIDNLNDRIKHLHDIVNRKQKEEFYGLGSFLWKGFQDDEALLIQLMKTAPPINGPYPTPDTPGNVEFGWVLYFLNVKLPETGTWGKWLHTFLKNEIDLPATTITSEDWTKWEQIWSSTGVLLGDGTLVSSQKYATMDLGWSLFVIEFLIHHFDKSLIADFNHIPNSIKISDTEHQSLSIAVIGDWGTGNYKDGPSSNSPSYQVMESIKELTPDMIIHLGDVYYAGTGSEEKSKLIDVWQYDAPLGNFTLNSNHEMYDGANGYYNVALASDLFKPYHTAPKSTTPTSYFSIEYRDFIIIGLDSAYNATDWYMNGRITDDHQPDFIKNAASGKNVILLTHHNPIDTLGNNKNDLWTDITGKNALNGVPYMWYWGHVHNGMVYNKNAASGAKTLARCLGNAAIPIGTGNWLKNKNIDYFTNTPLNDRTVKNALRVKNGFAVLTINEDGVQEKWYDQSGDQCWP